MKSRFNFVWVIFFKYHLYKNYPWIDSTTKVVLFFPSNLYCRGSLLVEKESGRADGRTGLGWAHLVSPFVPLASRHVSLAFLLLWLFSK